jgi:hypothetical protein
MEQRNVIRSGSVGEICHLADSFVLAVDLGFSKSRRTCGLAWSNGRSDQAETKQSQFGECVDKVCELLVSHRKAVLIVEAPLSGLFDKEGNPVERGEFERRNPNVASRSTRYWYSGPGAAMCLAAVFFLRELVRRLRENLGEALPREVVLYEGFITFKSETTDHSADAKRLLDAFFCGSCPVEEVHVSRGNLVLSILDVFGGAPAKPVAPAIIAPSHHGA